ncbi:uncharacterized protein LOC8280862 [Ricinus communis]|uniref:uncharacterized protein LOC8280862 n=1 Tax=Ricinus communis TaxID=3988 RepID=UPI0007724BD7|nr:uncharacterized protein LOC8280862 [Ricinus communis]|eukprot:XP_015573458.1 uncharacterized protein LOC8280862 [Ricinus communis]
MVQRFVVLRVTHVSIFFRLLLSSISNDIKFPFRTASLLHISFITHTLSLCLSLALCLIAPEMVYVSFIACLVATLVVLQSMIATSDFLAPLLSPIFDDACKKVECGKGTCKASSNSSFFYECECDPGWKQTRSDHDDTLKFLPCVVPNCTMDYSCVAAPSPIQDKSSKSNASVFDPCFWTDCGGGSCNKTSPFTYSCECTEGYYNLLNISAFPCFKECAIGMDCSNLGISMSNRSASPTPVLTESSNQASSLRESSHWLMILILSLAMI